MKKITKIISLAFAFALAFVGVAMAEVSTNVTSGTNVQVGTTSANVGASAAARADDDKDSMDDRGQGEDRSDNDGDKEDMDNDMSVEHRSAVAAYVAGLLNVSTRDKGIGAEVKTVAESQQNDAAKNEEAVKKISTRSKIKVFLFGSDYKNLGVLRSSMVKTEADIMHLKALLSKATDVTAKTELEAQIKLMEAEQAKITAFIKANETRITLFGWLKAK